MTRTSALLVNTDPYIKNEIQIHPNEGFDLKLMKTEANIKIYCNMNIQAFNDEKCEFIAGKIMLLNEIVPGTIKISHKFWKKIGSPEKIQIFFENFKLLLINIKE